jgi:hypothetical protein
VQLQVLSRALRAQCFQQNVMSVQSRLWAICNVTKHTLVAASPQDGQMSNSCVSAASAALVMTVITVTACINVTCKLLYSGRGSS